MTGEGKIDIHDQELRKQLNLTTADLRFADDLVKATVTDDASDLFLDDTSWEGGDEWLRGQFRHYMLSLLVASKSSGEAFSGGTQFSVQYVKDLPYMSNLPHTPAFFQHVWYVIVLTSCT